ncbi:NADH-quinone oxidoreductase subunit K [Xanthobacter sp. V0B-10]|uniref:NADH-quinone oxidoreductase subunit K n=1 Tax=Xanthobacter albus TaxID=3119929 RepID=UPI00372CCC36
MSTPAFFGLVGAALSAIGVYGLMVGRDALARILAFNLLGGGVFLVFGVVARRGAAAGFGADPVPQALVITGIVVAFSATALAVALLRRLAALRAGAVSARPAPEDEA